MIERANTKVVMLLLSLKEQRMDCYQRRDRIREKLVPLEVIKDESDKC